MKVIIMMILIVIILLITDKLVMSCGYGGPRLFRRFDLSIYMKIAEMASCVTLQEIARHLRPRTLRALFGRTKSHNVVHCTDLPEDAQLEVEYFFKILDQ